MLAVLGRIRNGGKVGEGTLEVVEALAGSDGHEIADGNQAETVTGCGFAEAFSAKQICQAAQSVRHLGQVA